MVLIFTRISIHLLHLEQKINGNFIQRKLLAEKGTGR